MNKITNDGSQCSLDRYPLVWLLTCNFCFIFGCLCVTSALLWRGTLFKPLLPLASTLKNRKQQEKHCDLKTCVELQDLMTVGNRVFSPTLHVAYDILTCTDMMVGMKQANVQMCEYIPLRPRHTGTCTPVCPIIMLTSSTMTARNCPSTY